MHSRSHKTIDPCICTMPERSASVFHRPGRHRVRQARRSRYLGWGGGGLGGIVALLSVPHDNFPCLQFPLLCILLSLTPCLLFPIPCSLPLNPYPLSRILILYPLSPIPCPLSPIPSFVPYPLPYFPCVFVLTPAFYPLSPVSNPVPLSVYPCFLSGVPNPMSVIRSRAIYPLSPIVFILSPLVWPLSAVPYPLFFIVFPFPIPYPLLATPCPNPLSVIPDPVSSIHSPLLSTPYLLSPIHCSSPPVSFPLPLVCYLLSAVLCPPL